MSYHKALNKTFIKTLIVITSVLLSQLRQFTNERIHYVIVQQNCPSTWQNTLCQLGIDPGYGNVLNKSYPINLKLTLDVAGLTLPTGKLPGMRQNSLCLPEIDPACGGTHSTDLKLTHDVVEQTLLTGN